MPGNDDSGYRVWRKIKPAVDAALILAAFAIAYWFRYDLQLIRQVEPAFHVRFGVYIPSVLTLIVIVLFWLWTEGSYHSTRGRLLIDEWVIVFKASITGVAVVIVLVFMATPSYYSRLIFAYAGVAMVLLLGAARTVEHAVLRRRRRVGIGVRHILIVGAGEIGRTLMRNVVARPELFYVIVGFVDDDPLKSHTDIGPCPALGTIDSLDRIIAERQVDEVIVTLPWVYHDRISEIMGTCEEINVEVRIVPDLFRTRLSSVKIETINGVPLLSLADTRLSETQSVLKRVIDIVISIVGLIILSPLMLLISLAIKIDSRGPVFFRQERVGMGGKPFTITKFRTMCADAENLKASLVDKNEATGPIFKIKDDPRRTRLGRFLRHGLDELPQLWNVLCGEMSFIGPRPPTPDEVEKYEPWHMRRLEVRPGITGLWQVSGRSDLSFDEMVLLDTYYIENWSLMLDFRIVFKTIPAVLTGSGGY